MERHREHGSAPGLAGALDHFDVLLRRTFDLPAHAVDVLQIIRCLGFRVRRRDRLLADVVAVLAQPDGAIAVDADRGEALVDSRPGDRRRDDVRQRGHLRIGQLVGHFPGHGRIEDRQ